MEELANCRKSINNVLPKQPCETLLVLDGTTGGYPGRGGI
jgi:signal recognition particle GTPase